MAGVIDSLINAIGKPGRKIYKTERKPNSFASMDLKEKLQTIVLDKRLIDRERRQRLNLNWYTVALFYRGYQQVAMNGSGSGLDVFEDEDYYIENQFRRHVDTVKQVLNKMEGDLVIRPASG